MLAFDEHLQHEFSRILLSRPSGDQLEAKHAINVLISHFGEHSLTEQIRRGNPTAIALRALAEGLSRLETFRLLNSYQMAMLAGCGQTPAPSPEAADGMMGSGVPLIC